MKQTVIEYLVLGAGPAGLQMGYELERQGRDYLILESGSNAGTFFELYPRHRKLLSINKVYTGIDDRETNLRWDWNSLLSDSEEMLFQNYSKAYLPNADDLVRYLRSFANHFNLNIDFNTHVVHITKGDGLFVLTDTEGRRFRSKRLIVATGMSVANVPPVRGIGMAEKYADVSTDPQDFTNQSVLIIGKGNSAFETADQLIETTTYIHVISPQCLSLAWESRFVGHLRAANNHFIDTYQLKCQNAILDGIVTKIEKAENGQFAVSVAYSHASSETEVLHYDRVILAAGFRFDNSLFDDPCRPRLAINDRFPEQTAGWESINIQDLYFAGTLMQMRDYKRCTSSFIHGFRYCIRALAHLLNYKYYERPWPSQTLAYEREQLLKYVIGRVNRTSALWQQFGFMCDLIVVEGERVAYYEDVPAELAQSTIFGGGRERYIITLEFGKVEGNLFNVERNPTPSHARKSTFLHPIVRHFKEGNLADEIHLLEDLHADWSKEVHRQPLREFFATRCLVR